MNRFTTKDFNKKGFDIIDNKIVYKGDKNYVLTFTADWCQPCKRLQTNLLKLEEKHSDIEFYTIEAEEEYKLSEIFNIKDLPTTILFTKNSMKVVDGYLPFDAFEDIFNHAFNLIAINI